jgi:hypothetical protein
MISELLQAFRHQTHVFRPSQQGQLLCGQCRRGGAGGHRAVSKTTSSRGESSRRKQSSEEERGSDPDHDEGDDDEDAEGHHVHTDALNLELVQTPTEVNNPMQTVCD